MTLLWNPIKILDHRLLFEQVPMRHWHQYILWLALLAFLIGRTPFELISLETYCAFSYGTSRGDIRLKGKANIATNRASLPRRSKHFHLCGFDR